MALNKRYPAIALSFAAAAAMAAPAMAAAPAVVTRTLFLAQHPASSSPRASTAVRSIYLAAGNYTMHSSLDDGNAAYTDSLGTRDIYLAAGTYNWVCYVDPQVRYQYTDGCSLTPTSFSGATANMGSGRFDLPHSGTWTITGELDPHF